MSTVSRDLSAVSLEAAERYEQEFVPAYFGEWAVRIVDLADVALGHRVLDVACGTGVVARECARRLDETGQVTGIDISEDMLAVARRVAPDIEWLQGEAGSLPFPEAAFDRVICQFALPFFPDRVKAVSEMRRVLTPQGRLVLSVPGPLETNPVYRILAELLGRRVGDAGAEIVESYFVLGQRARVEAIFTAAGLTDVSVNTEWGTNRYPSVRSFVEAEIRAWAPLSELVSEPALETLVSDARQAFAPWTGDDGQVRFQSPTHIVLAPARREGFSNGSL